MIKKLISLACFLVFMVLLLEAVPWIWEVYELVKTNPGGKLNGTQQFAGIIVVGINGGFVLGALIVSAFGIVIPLLPPSKYGTGSTGPR